MKNNHLWLWLGGGVAFLLIAGGGGAVIYNQTRGLRNNNPGNLRPTSDKWLGISGVDTVGGAGSFLKFSKPEYGIRALFHNLLTYRTKYGLTTVRDIITRWAPAADGNNTPVYIASVAAQLGKNPDSVLNLSDYPALVKAIIHHENGVNPYPDALIASGMGLA